MCTGVCYSQFNAAVLYIEQTLAVNMDLSLNILFDQPTVAEVAQHIEQMRCTAQTLQAPITRDSDERAEIEL